MVMVAQEHCLDINRKPLDSLNIMLFWPLPHLYPTIGQLTGPFSVAESPPGVYLYLGYSKKDSLILQRGRVSLGKKVPDTEEEERKEVKDTVQQTVSHFTSNTNKVNDHFIVPLPCQ